MPIPTRTIAQIDAAINANVPSAMHATLQDALDGAERVSALTGGQSGYFGVSFSQLLPRLRQRIAAETGDYTVRINEEQREYLERAIKALINYEFLRPQQRTECEVLQRMLSDLPTVDRTHEVVHGFAL